MKNVQRVLQGDAPEVFNLMDIWAREREFI